MGVAFALFAIFGLALLWHHARKRDLLWHLDLIVKELRDDQYEIIVEKTGTTTHVELKNATTEIWYENSARYERLLIRTFCPDGSMYSMLGRRTGDQQFFSPIGFARSNTLRGKCLYAVAGRIFGTKSHECFTRTKDLVLLRANCDSHTS